MSSRKDHGFAIIATVNGKDNVECTGDIVWDYKHTGQRLNGRLYASDMMSHMFGESCMVEEDRQNRYWQL